MPQAIIWTNAVPIHWRIYAALQGDELKYLGILCHGDFIKYSQICDTHLQLKEVMIITQYTTKFRLYDLDH